MNRIVGQFSCGAASAVAIKLAQAKYGHIEIINAYLKEEHEDNRRFLKDCEKWFDQKVTVLRDEKYGASAYEVFRQVRYIKSMYGAACSTRLKRNLLDGWRNSTDTIVLGFTAEERDRSELWQDRTDIKAIFPLIDEGLTKADCLGMLERAGIEIPAMYKLGFHNANCIGCPKGGKGYWNHIRTVFPETFKEMSDIEQSLGLGAYLFYDQKTKARTSLLDLKPDEGRHDIEPDITCSFFCQMAEQDLKEGQ